MSLPAFQTTVVNGTGDILTAATVTVTVESTGAAAVLFSDRNGTIGLGSGGVFSVNGTTAFAQFFAAPGEYRIEANDAVSGFSETWRYQVLAGTASLANTGTGANDVPTNADVRNPRNRIVNPSMAISQENGFGTSVVPADTNFYIADEVDTRVTTGSGAVLETSYQTLDGERSTRITATTAATTLTGTEQVGRHRIRLEKSNLHQLDNGDVVLAFKCRTNWSGKIPVALQNGDGTRTYVSDFDVVAGINQVFKVIPFEASTVGSEPDENEKALQFDLGYNNEDTYQQPAANNDAWQTGNFFCSDESTQWTKTINNYVEITNVDLYAGNVPREFQPNSYAQDLAGCQRYWEQGRAYLEAYGGAGQSLSLTGKFNTPKRDGVVVTPVDNGSVFCSTSWLANEVQTSEFRATTNKDGATGAFLARVLFTANARL